MTRGHANSPVTVPNAVLVGEVLGAVNCGWFNALIASARNWICARSLTCVFLISDKSQLFGPSARTPEKRDGRVQRFDPSWRAVLRSNPASTLNQRLTVR